MTNDIAVKADNLGTWGRDEYIRTRGECNVRVAELLVRECDVNCTRYKGRRKAPSGERSWVQLER